MVRLGPITPVYELGKVEPVGHDHSGGSSIPWSDVDLLPWEDVKVFSQIICAYCGTPCKDGMKEKCAWCGAPLIDL